MAVAWVYVGLTARRDSVGKPLCEVCGRRLSKVKHHRPHGVGRACAPRCNVSVVAPSPTSPSCVVGHSDPGKSAPSLILAPRPRPPPFLQISTWHTHGWLHVKATQTTAVMASAWFKLAIHRELNSWELKRGGFYQHDTAMTLASTFLDRHRLRIRDYSEVIAREQLSLMGVNTLPLQLAAIKLLKAPPGKGLQEIHYDIPVYADAIRCYSFLIYITSTLSTATPTLPLKAMRHCFTDGEKHPSAEALKILTRDKFISKRVKTGDMLILNCAVPHYGVANPDDDIRYVLFLLFYPSSMPMPDTEVQRYPNGVKN